MSDSKPILPLELSGISFEVRGRRLLDAVDVRFEAGPRTIILGPNGAGKSLTLRIAHGLLAPSSGEVCWANTDARAVRRGQAMVFQRSILLRRSAAANIEFALKVRGVDRAARKERTRHVLAQTGLSDLADRRARVLSAGEQQRLALARAWVLEPQVLFLDEPTAALDPAATSAVETLISEIARLGTKIIMTTHDMGQARRLADEVLFFHAGRLLELSPAESFFAEPSTPEARAFLKGELVW